MSVVNGSDRKIEKIKQIRKQFHLTQSDMMGIIGIKNLQTYSMMEKGKRRLKPVEWQNFYERYAGIIDNDIVESFVKDNIDMRLSDAMFLMRYLEVHNMLNETGSRLTKSLINKYGVKF